MNIVYGVGYLPRNTTKPDDNLTIAEIGILIIAGPFNTFGLAEEAFDFDNASGRSMDGYDKIVLEWDLTTGRHVGF